MGSHRAAALLAAALLGVSALGAQPKIQIEGGMTFDFGELRTLAPVSRELRLTNAGTDTLHIRDVSGSCGCTGTLLSRHDIPPGGEGLLRITFDPAKFKGKVEKAVSMKTDDPAHPNPHINFTAFVTQIIDFSVSHVAMTTPVDSEAAGIVTVRNVSDKPIRILSATAAPADLFVSMTPSELAPGESGQLLCRIRPTKAGIIKGDITIATDNPLLPTVELRYFVYAKAAPQGASSDGVR